MKKFIASAGALVLATAMLASCSAYSNPEKYIEIPDLKSITVNQADLDADMKEQIDEILEKSRKENFKEIDETATDGDQVNIDFEGRAADSGVTLSESTLKGMKAEKQDVIIGSGSMIGEYKKDGEVITEGFEEQLKGMKAGDKKDITVTFPDSYDTAELKGVKAIFTITCHSVSRLSVDDNCLVKVEYTFVDPDAEAEEGEDAADAQSEDSEETKKFTDLFEDGDFEIDLSAEKDDKNTFNEIFKADDFRDDLKDKHLYEDFPVTVTIPDDVDEDYQKYAGRDIVINLSIESATVLPAWDDAFVKEYTSESYDNVADYEADLMKDIKMTAAYDAILAAVTVNEYPESETEKAYKGYVDQLVDQKVQSLANKTLDEMTASELDKLIDEATYQTIYSQAASYAVAEVKERLVMEYLIDLLEVELSSKDYKDKLKTMYEEYTVNMYYFYSYYGVMFADENDLENYYGKENLELQFKFEKVQEMLPDQITIQ